MRNTFLMTTVWSALVCLGFVIQWNYEARPGMHSELPPVWPSSLERSDRDFELLVFVHPHCPCSLATVRELSHIVAAQPDSASVRVIAWQPANADSDWKSSRLLTAAREIPGVQVHFDSGGRVSAELGVRTSGQVFLFGKGRLARYSGGITVSRGHEGMNRGRRTVESILTGSPHDSLQTIPAFGCRIR